MIAAVTATIALTLGFVSPAAAAPAIHRIAGADRYETAVELATFLPGPSGVVYLTSGLNYPDALSASSAAAREGGVLLLTGPNALPPSVVEYLTSYPIHRVVIVGGQSVISPNIHVQLAGLLPGATILRIAGEDRYETSMLLADYSAGSSTPLDLVIFATGREFPDALSAGPAAGLAGAPLVLGYGLASAGSPALEDFIARHNVVGGFVVGGTGVVTAALHTWIDDRVSMTVRLGGANRYETNLLLMQRIEAAGWISGENFITLATGTSFADALGAGTYSAAWPQPLFLTPPTCVWPTVDA